MHPAFSVILLTTFIGAGQGLFLALYAAEVGARLERLPQQPASFYVTGSAVILLFVGAGLVASFFHLGRPERAWRAAAMWRTSWLSREVIAIPTFMMFVLLYALMHQGGYRGTIAVGAITTLGCLALFVCTAMIYACIRFLQEWATPLTIVNFILLGVASGYTLAAAYSLSAASELTQFYGKWAIVFTLLALCGRIASLRRNARIRPKSSLQTAIGVKHPHIEQKAQGFIGSSFNTREFLHGHPRTVVRAVKWAFLLFGFVLPVVCVAAGTFRNVSVLVAIGFLLQFGGLIAERWYFFAEARHPQNLYYQAMS